MPQLIIILAEARVTRLNDIVQEVDSLDGSGNPGSIDRFSLARANPHSFPDEPAPASRNVVQGIFPARTFVVMVFSLKE